MSTIWQRIGDFLFDGVMAAATRHSRLQAFMLDMSFGQVAFLHRPVAATANSTEAIFLLHGATADNSAWLTFCQHFNSTLPLYIPDLPGHGKSVKDLALDYSIGAQAQRIAEMLRVLGIRRVHFIANSMGGACALQLAAQQPELVASLLLIDSAGADVSLSWLTQHLAAGGSDPFGQVRGIADFRAMLQLSMEKPPYLPGFAVASLARRFQQRIAINRKIIDDIHTDLDLSAVLPQVQTKTLLIWGEQDRLLPPVNAHYLQQRIKDSRCIILPGIGHVPMVEAPKQVAQLCDDFYTQLGKP